MKFKNYVLIALVGLSLNTRAAESEEDFNTAFLAMFDSLKTNFSFLDDAEPSRVEAHEIFYANEKLSLPRMESSSFSENKNSKQRMLKIVLDFNLTDAKEQKAFDDMQLEFYKLPTYWIKAYTYNEADRRLMFFVRDRQNKNQFIGGFIVKMEDGKAILQLYPFDRAKFFEDLKKVCEAGVENNFATYKGEINKLQENNWRSTCTFYQTDYSVYSVDFDFLDDTLYKHTSIYLALPSQMIMQLIGGKDVVKQALGSGFRVLSFEKKDEGDNSFSIIVKVESKERDLVIWLSESHGMQSVRVLIRE